MFKGIRRFSSLTVHSDKVARLKFGNTSSNRNLPKCKTCCFPQYFMEEHILQTISSSFSEHRNKCGDVLEVLCTTQAASI